jgi:alpha-tubulin suppressor-like RCC1 family protein
VRKSLSVSAGLCALLAAAVAAAGCSSGQPGSLTAPPRQQSGAPPGSGQPVSGPAGATVLRWGSFFGGPKGNFGTRTTPVTVRLPGKIAQVGSSNSTEYALLADGRLYAWGLGTQGQLGDGRLRNSISRAVRVRFPAGVRIASIPADVMPYDTGLAVDTSGHVWGWGRNHGGELCRGNHKTYRSPVRLPFTRVTALAGASNHAVYDAAGTVYACGQNVAGDLGTGSMNNTTTPVRVAGLDGARVTLLVASFANSGALLSDGRYFDWGYDSGGQLGDGRPRRSSDVPIHVKLPHPVKEVAQGGSLWDNGQTLALLSDGSLWSWGTNQSYQLGNGSRRLRLAPARFRAPAGVTFASLATGSQTSYGLATTGQVYAWGVSHVGQVGNGKTSTVAAPVVVASGATLISATANNVVIGVAGQS